MFTCNNINLLSFTYYLKCILVFNMIIVPFLYFYINLIIIIRKRLIINKWLLQKKMKTFFYILVLFCFSLIIHNMLNNNRNICYIYATPNIYHQYKNSYYFLENKEIDDNIKNNYLNNILSKKDNTNLTNIIYKQANIIENEIIQKNNISQDNFLHETDSNKQNNVYILDGVFYYPNYVYGNYNTYSGINCPTKKEINNYNNPYGYNNYFYTRLDSFIKEASKNGYKITISDQGCRKYDTQVYYYNTMEHGRAIYPGYSLHGFGIASDLEFYNKDGTICNSYRTDISCQSMGWAHTNANRFGLSFPLLNSNYREDWHIEPLYKNKY